MGIEPPPYLMAIQAIAGATPGEKQRTINIIARKLAGLKHSRTSSGDPGISDTDVPGPLEPLLRVEVAKIQRSYEGIIEALKSEDIIVVARAIQATWFFEGSNSTVINASYFLENVFPQISLYARSRIIRSFGIHLKHTAVAAEFFLTVTEQYGVSQAVPLLAACEESFAWKMINEKKIVLPYKAVETIYRKYPDLVINYLKLGKPAEPDTRNLHNVQIGEYINFLPEIANKRFDDFIEILNMCSGPLNVKLGKKATSIFVKTRLNLLVEQPNRYLGIVPLKIISQKLSSDDFARMFKNVFPEKIDDFRYEDVSSVLKYYKPEQDKVSLILNTFKTVYGKDLLSCKELITTDIIKILPPADRIHQARLRLENDKDWHLSDTEESWRCYLPAREAIPIIKKEITKCSDANKRVELLYQLIYTCKANDDKDAFLSVLNYIYEKYRNDRKHIFYGCVNKFVEWFDLAKLDSQHWEVLDKYIKIVEMYEDFPGRRDAFTKLLESALHYRMLNQLSLDNHLRILIDWEMKLFYQNWDFFEEYPLLKKRFLDLIIKNIPKQYPFNDKTWDEKFRVLQSLTSALWNCNNRVKVSNGELNKFSIKDYPWLFEKIQHLVLTVHPDNIYQRDSIMLSIRENEFDLYNDWIREVPYFWRCNLRIICDVLLKQHQRVLKNWQDCYDRAQGTSIRKNCFRIFLQKIKWCQTLPINFFSESLKSYNDPIKYDNSIATLALLSDGETFAKIVEPFLPTDNKMDVDDPNANLNYKIVRAIGLIMRKVNPPVSLDLIGQFCVGDYLGRAIPSVVSICCRVPVIKVILFAKILAKRRVSVMKHGIRLMYLVAPLDEIFTFLTDLWDNETHPSIRAVVFKKIYDVFFNQPDPRTWSMLKKCVKNLNVNDDEKIFETLPNLSNMPCQYIEEYITTVLSAMESMKEKSEDPQTYVNLGCGLIQNIDRSITKILSEDYSQNLIRKYLFVFDYDRRIFGAGVNFAVSSYLLGSRDYNEARFKFFGDFFRETVKQHWDKAHPKYFNFYPINHMISQFFSKIIIEATVEYDVRILESLFEIFNSALKPYQDADSYLHLVFSIEYKNSATSVDFGIKIAQKIPELIEIFSPEYIIPISNQLSSFIMSQESRNTKSSEEQKLDIIEVLVQRGEIHYALIAADLLFATESKELNVRLKAIIHALREFNHPSVLGILNQSLLEFACGEYLED